MLSGTKMQDAFALFLSEITQSDQSSCQLLSSHSCHSKQEKQNCDTSWISTGVFLVTLMAETIYLGIIAQFKAAANPAQSESQAVLR